MQGIPSQLRLALLAAAVLGATALVLNCESSGSSHSAPSSIPSAALQEGSSTLAQWRKIRTLLTSSANRTEVACDDKALSEIHAGAPGRVLLVDSQYLRRFEPPYASPYNGIESDWRVLTHARLLAIEPKRLQGASPGFVDALLAARALTLYADYWGVLETTERRLPKVDAGGFQPGSVTGWLLVVNPKTPHLMCQASISATSSEAVSRAAHVEAKTAVRRDFAFQIRNGLDAGLRRISRQLALVAD